MTIPLREKTYINKLNILKGIKVNEAIKIIFSKINHVDDTIDYVTKNFDINFIFTNESEIHDKLVNATEEYIEKMLNGKTLFGSGWTIEQFKCIYMNIAGYQPMVGSSYIELPAWIHNKNAIINPKNDDDNCFKWACGIGLYLQTIDSDIKHIERLPKCLQEFCQSINLENIDIPIKVNNRTYNKILDQNDFTFNVYSYDDFSEYNELVDDDKKKDCIIFPLFVVDQPKSKHVNLFYHSIIDEKLDERKSHYTYIKDINKLLFKINKHNSKTHVCLKCLHNFSSEKLLNEHLSDNLCTKKDGPVKCVYPAEGSVVEFKSFQKQLKAPFAIYADFECLTTEYHKEGVQTAEYQKHIPSSYGFKVVSEFNDSLSFNLEIYRGDKVVPHFLNRLFEIEKNILQLVSLNKPLKMSDNDNKKHKESDYCHICKTPFIGGEKKIRDHCHITGRYRGAAHDRCNINFNYKNYYIPVFIHNSKGYDTHLIMQHIAQYENKRIECIPKTEEKYTCFSIGKLRFLDSLAFLNSSLSSLVDNLAGVSEKNLEPNINNFPITVEHFKDLSLDKIKLLIRKGVYPYDYINNSERFNETQLPPKNAFFSSLTNQHISDNDYMHAVNVWNKLKIKNLGEYNDLYLKTDVLLLADVFESFRKMYLEYYALDPCHYVTLPAFGWDASLRLHNKKLELFSGKQSSMYLKTEDSIRGGISMIVNKYSKANNKYLRSYDKNKPSTYIIYLDANNLYGWAISQPLPFGDYKYEKIY